MTTNFRGLFDCKVDGKGRLILPAAYRSSLLEQESSLVITNSHYQKEACLDVYPLAEWEKLEQKIAKLPALKPKVQAYQRFYLASGQVVPVDSQNRIRVPARLRKYVGLKEEGVLVGMGKKFEVWPARAWQGLYQNLAQNFEDILISVASMESEL